MRCEACGSNLSKPDSVRYTEVYLAKMVQDKEHQVVVYDGDSVGSQAVCAKCRTEIDYSDAEQS